MDLPLKISRLDQLLNLIDTKRFSEISTDSISEISVGISTICIIHHPDYDLYRAIKYPDKPKNIEKLIYPPFDKAKKNRAS
jgi:hypothetical protein